MTLKTTMKVTLIAAMSVDGKITKWNDIQDVATWASTEDQKFFLSMIQKHKVIVMGRKTYEAVKHRLKIEEGRKRIVMTRHPQDHKQDEIAGKLEFSSESPDDLVRRMESEGYSELLVVGGGRVNTAFLKNGLVNEIYLTIEPKIFGKGTTLVFAEKMNIQLRLENIKKLNDGGSLSLHYKVLQL